MKNKIFGYAKKINKKQLLLVAGFFVFFAAGYHLGQKRNIADLENNIEEKDYQQIRQSGYKFINPLLECEIGEIPSFKPMEKEIKNNLNEEVLNKNSNVEIGIYFRGLNSGTSFGINEQKVFSPASLLKVPLMMAYFKVAERDPRILDEKTIFNPADVQFRQSVPSFRVLEKGKEYTMEELIEKMIIHSDNDSLALLFQNINRKDLEKVFSDLGIGMPDIYNANNSMPVKDFASFFRILYNASYLNKEMSEKALEILSRSQFSAGIVSGVPAGTLVSHKFGEREQMQEGKVVRQLHDCGIVYYNPYPYLVCVMTRGDDFSSLSKGISEISKVVFEGVSSKYK